MAGRSVLAGLCVRDPAYDFDTRLRLQRVRRPQRRDLHIHLSVAQTHGELVFGIAYRVLAIVGAWTAVILLQRRKTQAAGIARTHSAK